MKITWETLPINLAVSWVLIVAASAVAAPWISPFDPAAIDIGHVLEGPSTRHWLGTDELGRDLLGRMLFGGRVSLVVGFIAVGIAIALGVAIGAAAGAFGGVLDRVLMTLVDIFLCFPAYFLILASIAFLEPALTHIMVIIGLTGWMGVARMVRAEILSLREREFVLASRALGAGPFRIIRKDLLPNAMAPIFVSSILGIANAILIESSLSFLGIGVQPPQPSWGNILAGGKESASFAWWLMTCPGLAILFTVLSCNLIGETIRHGSSIREHRAP